MSVKMYWELINSEGITQVEFRSANPHPLSLGYKMYYYAGTENIVERSFWSGLSGSWQENPKRKNS